MKALNPSLYLSENWGQAQSSLADHSLGRGSSSRPSRSCPLQPARILGAPDLLSWRTRKAGKWHLEQLLAVGNHVGEALGGRHVFIQVFLIWFPHSAPPVNRPAMRGQREVSIICACGRAVLAMVSNEGGSGEVLFFQVWPQGLTSQRWNFHQCHQQMGPVSMPTATFYSYFSRILSVLPNKSSDNPH